MPDDGREMPELRERRERQASAVRRRRRRLVAALLGVAVLIGGAIAVAGGGSDDPPPFLAGQPAGGSEGSPAPARFTVAATGDFLIHGPVYERARSFGGGGEYDFEPMLRPIKRYVDGADLGICHIETPMGPGPPSGYPVFNTPKSLATAAKEIGWDVCDTASNHTLDGGQEGVDATVKALDRAGLGHTGSASSAAEQKKPLIVDVKGVKVALLAYTEMTNGVPPPKPWSVNLAGGPRILADAREARDAGAEVVIVNLHAGDEFVAEPSDVQKKLARRLTESPDITAVIGQHVHIVQPIDRVNDKPVVYGEGNLVSNQTVACCPEASQDGLIALLDFVVDEQGPRVDAVRYVPVYVQHPDFEVLPVADALDSGEGDASALRASYQRTRKVVGRGQGIEPVPERLP